MSSVRLREARQCVRFLLHIRRTAKVVVAMQPIVWTENAEQTESLALSLRAILAGRDVACAYEQLVALLGLGAAVTADPEECIAHWPQLARDAALRDAADVCGLRMRDLHPPDAAVGVYRSAEFPQHFSDSYLPLIRAALLNDQPVLALDGWAQPAGADTLNWGVLYRLDGDLPAGRVPASQGRDVRLTSAARQVYVVEDYAPTLGALDHPGVLFAVAVRAAQTFWSGRVALRHGVRSGAAAYQTLAAAIECGALCPRCRRTTGVCAATAVGALIGSRRAHAAWLRSIAGELGRDHHRAAVQWADQCDRVADQVAPLRGETGANQSPAGRTGSSRLAAALFEIGQTEAVTIARLLEATAQGAAAGCAF